VWKKLRRGMGRNFDDSCNGKLVKSSISPFCPSDNSKAQKCKNFGVPWSPSLLHALRTKQNTLHKENQLKVNEANYIQVMLQ
jgi:hypothetical protein